jgi:hypothetical protein
MDVDDSGTRQRGKGGHYSGGKQHGWQQTTPETETLHH